jgi:hypothetical protein
MNHSAFSRRFWAVPSLGLFAAWLAVAGAAVSAAADADDKPADKQAQGKPYAIAEGKFKLTPPANWVVKPPKNFIIEHEFEVPAAEGDETPARVTVMGAGGSIEANVQRWRDQFTPADGAEAKDAAKVEKKKIAGQQVHVVNLSGNYLDKAPAQAKGVERENYRMLAAIIETTQGGKKTGNYFIKLVGPAQTVGENEEGFEKMLESLSSK